MSKKYLFPGLATLAFIVTLALTAQDREYAPPSKSDSPESVVVPDTAIPKNSIVMLADRYEPSRLTIKQGETVTFINRDSDDHWPASDKHPSHQIYPQFDPKRSIKPGKSWGFTFTLVGTWQLHDHIYPSITGEVTVEL